MLVKLCKMLIILWNSASGVEKKRRGPASLQAASTEAGKQKVVGAHGSAADPSAQDAEYGAAHARQQ